MRGCKRASFCSASNVSLWNSGLRFSSASGHSSQFAACPLSVSRGAALCFPRVAALMALRSTATTTAKATPPATT